MSFRGRALSPYGASGVVPGGPAFHAALLALVAALGAHDPAAALTLTRYPWVSLQTETSVLIAWQTDVAVGGKVLYGLTPALGSEATHSGSAANHAVPLTGLAGSSQYYYRIVSGTDTLTAGDDTFRTAPSVFAPFRFVAFGDLGRATSEQIAVAARIDSLNADLGILTGDIIYEAGEAANFTPQYFNIYRPTIARVPFYPSLGNHDVATSSGQPYLDAFYLPSNNPAATERYYSFDYSNAHFAALEVTVENATPGAAMLAWLDADLAATDRHWKFVFFHVPMYSNPGVHGDDPTITAALEPILNARGVDVVFQGHNHYYTRTYPLLGGTVVAQSQEPTYLSPGGAIYIVTGGAGRSLYALGAAPGYQAYAKSTFHTTVVDVVGTTLTLKAVERDGTVIDTMTLTKDSATGATLDAERETADGPPRITFGPIRPNPLAREGEIALALDRPAPVRVSIHDASGRLVRVLAERTLGPGPHRLAWDGSDAAGRPAPSGIYFALLESGAERARAKLVLLR